MHLKMSMQCRSPFRIFYTIWTDETKLKNVASCPHGFQNRTRLLSRSLESHKNNKSNDVSQVRDRLQM